MDVMLAHMITASTDFYMLPSGIYDPSMTPFPGHRMRHPLGPACGKEMFRQAVGASRDVNAQGPH